MKVKVLTWYQNTEVSDVYHQAKFESSARECLDESRMIVVLLLFFVVVFLWVAKSELILTDYKGPYHIIHLNQTRRANFQMIHLHHTYRTYSQSAHQSDEPFGLLHATLQQNDYTCFRYPRTSNLG